MCRLFDHLVGDGEHAGRNGDTESINAVTKPMTADKMRLNLTTTSAPSWPRVQFPRADRFTVLAVVPVWEQRGLPSVQAGPGLKYSG
jgi:hypothetical protein